MFFKAATTVVLALAASLPSAMAAAAQSCTRTYTVKAGDTCDGISASQSVSSYQLVANNPNINTGCTNLQVGQSLCLGTQGEDCDDVVVVEAGDTCNDLLECAGINATVFYLNNPTVNEDCTNLFVGQAVCVSSQVLVPPMGASEPSSAPAPPVAASSVAPVNVAPSPSVQSTPPAAASSVAPTNVAPAPIVHSTPSSVSASPSVHSSAPASTPSDDDGDLPFCDELEDDDEEDWN